MPSNPETFIDESVRYLLNVHLVRLEQAFQALPEADVWWRPHEGCLSFGNILLHLEGNVHQWLVSGLGGMQDHRNRASEFSTSDGLDGRDLLLRLRKTVEEAAEILRSLDEGTLAGAFSIQGFETTGQNAIYHVVEHFSWHTGQAVWIAKARGGPAHGLAFYDDSKINAQRNG